MSGAKKGGVACPAKQLQIKILHLQPIERTKHQSSSISSKTNRAKGSWKGKPKGKTAKKGGKYIKNTWGFSLKQRRLKYPALKQYKQS